MDHLLSRRDDAAPSALLVAVGGAVALGVYYASTKQHGERRASQLRDPRAHPDTSLLLGDLPAYLHNEDRIHDWMTETSARVGDDSWVLRIPGQRNLVVVTKPEEVEEILATQFAKFPRGEFQIEYLEPLFGYAIINSDGQRWYHQRKAAAKFFTARSLRTCMVTTMQKNVLQMYEVVDESMASGGTVNLVRLFHEFALQTFCEVGLGLDLRWIGHDEPNPLAKAIVDSSAAILRRFRVPATFWKLQRFLNVGGERELATSMASVRVWIRSVLDKSLDALGKEKKGGRADGSTADGEDDIKSVLELFIEQGHENVEGMGPDDLVDFILTFVLAAYDTSSVALSWFFLMLTKHPEIEAKIRAEMASVLPGMGIDADTFLMTDHVQGLVYLDATIKEVMRLYPPIPLIQREVGEDAVVCGDLLLPKGSLIGISVYAMARSERVWGPDACELKPERWIDPKTGGLITVPSNTFTPFSAGPRICIGMKLAMMELRVATANLLHRYRFSIAVPNDASYVTMIGLSLKHPLIVTAARTTASAA